MQTPEPLHVLHWLVSEVPRNLPVPLQVLQRPEPRQDTQRLSELPDADPPLELPETPVETQPSERTAMKQNTLNSKSFSMTHGLAFMSSFPWLFSSCASCVAHGLAATNPATNLTYSSFRLMAGSRGRGAGKIHLAPVSSSQ
jgi:hypothetical protein